MDFSPYHAVLLDLDGTIYHEEHPLPGAVALIRRLQAEGQPFACLSNSTSSPERLKLRLARMGAQVPPALIYTAAAATCDYVLDRFGSPADAYAARTDEPPAPPRRPRVFNLSTEAVDEMLSGRVDWVQTEGEPCDAVIVGAPTNVFATDDRQRVALQLLRKGAALVGICADRIYPSPRGLEFGVGSLSAMMAYAANVQPVFCGKPETIFFEELCQRLRVAPEWCLLVGDNLEADVAGAKRMGMRTILTLTGVTRRRDLLNLPEDRRPDRVVEDLRELV